MVDALINDAVFELFLKGYSSEIRRFWDSQSQNWHAR